MTLPLMQLIANLFFHERLHIPEVHSEPSQTFEIEPSANLVYGQKLVTTSEKCCPRYLTWF